MNHRCPREPGKVILRVGHIPAPRYQNDLKWREGPGAAIAMGPLAGMQVLQQRVEYLAGRAPVRTEVQSHHCSTFEHGRRSSERVPRQIAMFIVHQ